MREYDSMLEYPTPTPRDVEIKAFLETQERRREALRKEGYTFFLKIKPKSFAQLVEENPNYFEGEPLFLKWRPSGIKSLILKFPSWVKFIPQEVELAINPSQLFLPDSNGDSQGTQMKMIKAHGVELRKRNPYLEGVRFEMPHASVVAQLDRAYQEANNGEKLLKDCMVRTLDNNYSGILPMYVNVGRESSGDRLQFNNKSVLPGFKSIFGLQVVAMPVAVLPQR